MLLTKEVTLNLKYRENPVVMDAMQGDSGRVLVARFTAGETQWEIPEDAQVALQYRCADGTGGCYDALPDGSPAYAVNGDALTVFLIPELCAVAGVTKLQVTVFSAGMQISAFPVEIRVAEQVSAEPAGSEYYNLHKWLYSQVREQDFIDAVVAQIPNGDEVSY